MYECNALAFIAEQAGARHQWASRILDIPIASSANSGLCGFIEYNEERQSM